MGFCDWQYVWPRVVGSRAEYVDHSRRAGTWPTPALDRFNAAQRLNLNLLAAVAALLLGVVLFSVTIGPQTQFAAPSAARGGK